METEINGHAQPEAVGKRTARGTLAGWLPQPDNLKHVPALAIRSLPAVLLGTLLNILDGISCEYFVTRPAPYGRSLTNASLDGMIIFPATGVFEHLGGVGVSMFFVR